MHLEALSHKIVDVAPEELHQHDEKTDEECHQEKRQEALQHEPI